MATDYYAVLGVPRDASQEEIKKAFRRLARETHPDANPGDVAADSRFREIAEAYEVLSDPDRRRRYDRGDTIDLGDLFGAGFGGFDDLLRSVFGDSGLFSQGGGTSRTPRGRDILARAEVDLAQAAFGGDVEVSFRTNVTCKTCNGDGAEPGSRRIDCGACSGTGVVRMARRSLLGTIQTVGTCPTCQGSGELIATPCGACGGQGVHPETRSVKVELPAGVSTGTRLRLNREGESAPRQGVPGDLYVEVAVRPDPRYERDGDDLVHRVSIGIAEAALGTTVEVPLIEGGSERLEVAAGTQPGAVRRVAGAGMGRLGRRGRGDLIIEIGVTIPSDLSVEEEDLLRRFAELRKEQPSDSRRRRRR